MSSAIDKLMQELDAKAAGTEGLNMLEKALYDIGFMTGSMAPLRRAGLGFGVGYLAMMAVRPSFAYRPDGSSRPWSLTSPSPDSTALPWFAVPFGLAVFLGMFV